MFATAANIEVFKRDLFREVRDPRPAMFGKLARMFRSLLFIQDTPHSIALGTAIGLFIAWTPTVGIHMILVVAAAMLLRANKLAGLVAVYVSNPLTMLPMYWIEYWLGALVLEQRFTYDEMRRALDYSGWDGFKSAIWTLCVELAGPMWLGGLVLAIASAVPGYYLTRWAVERFQARQVIPAAAVDRTTGQATDSPVIAASPAGVGETTQSAIATDHSLTTHHSPSS